MANDDPWRKIGNRVGKSTHVAAFLDTNVLLHYPVFRGIQWKSLLDATGVTLIVCGTVVEELDEKKNHSSLGRRAAKTIGKIRNLRQNDGAVEDGVRLLCLAPGTQLDSTKPDARIRFEAREYLLQNSDQRIVVVSEDHGMELGCEVDGLVCVHPELEDRLESPDSSEQRRRRAVENELSRLKRTMPEWGASLVPGEHQEFAKGHVVTFQLSKSAVVEDIPSALKAARAGNSPIALEALGAVGGFFEISRDAAQVYNQKLHSYFEDLRSYLEELNEVRREYARRLEFRVHLTNCGGAPVNNVRVSIEFPDTVGFITYRGDSAGAVPSLRREPAPPVRPSSIANVAEAILGRSSLEDAAFHIPRPRLPYSIELGAVEGGLGIQIRVDKIPHQQEGWVSEEFTLGFSSWEGAKTFEAGVAISADNLASKAELRLLFKIEVTTE